MVRPFERERGRTLYSDPPLCELFRLSRWLSGSGAPDRLTVKRGVVVAPRDNLQSVQEEIDYFKRVQPPGAAWSIPLLTTADVRRELQGGAAQLFHFSCHGNFQADDADESRLKLEDGFLMPSNIRFDDRLALWQSAPLVFLNACHAGRVGLTVTRLGGWAECFIQAGATAFVGSLWEINDKLAAKFAREFYDRLWGLGGHAAQTAGEAFYAARMALKAEDEANPTWLAYVFYGDPNGRIVFGS
jgi:CHAT domain-containing protein